MTTPTKRDYERARETLASYCYCTHYSSETSLCDICKVATALAEQREKIAEQADVRGLVCFAAAIRKGDS